MKRARRRRCLCCHELFKPDSRNRRHQRYCCKPACQCASHIASQHRWLTKAENRDYFRGPIHVARVQAWRRAHPDYGARAQACICARRYKMTPARNLLILRLILQS